MKINVLIIFLLSLTIVACVETIQVPDSVVEQLNEKIDQLESSVTTLPTKSIEVPDSVLGQLNEKIGQLESSVSTLSTKSIEVPDSIIGQLNEKVGQLESSVSTLSSQSSTLTNQESQIDKLSEKINQLETKILSLEKTVNLTLNQTDVDTNGIKNTDYPFTLDGLFFTDTFNGHTIYDWKCDGNTAVGKATVFVIDAQYFDISPFLVNSSWDSSVPISECITVFDDGFDQDIHSILPGSFGAAFLESDNRLLDGTHDIDAISNQGMSFATDRNFNSNGKRKVVMTYKYFLTNPSLQRD